MPLATVKIIVDTAAAGVARNPRPPGVSPLEVQMKCPHCGDRPLRGGRDADLLHEKQWDADGDESCAHWAVRERYCANCGRTCTERIYYGLHRYCRVPARPRR